MKLICSSNILARHLSAQAAAFNPAPSVRVLPWQQADRQCLLHSLFLTIGLLFSLQRAAFTKWGWGTPFRLPSGPGERVVPWQLFRHRVAQEQVVLSCSVWAGSTKLRVISRNFTRWSNCWEDSGGLLKMYWEYLLEGFDFLQSNSYV